jgi:hypothetical protein
VHEEGDLQPQALRKVFKELRQVVNVLLLLILERFLDTLIEFERHEEVLIDSVENDNLFLKIGIRCIVSLKEFRENTGCGIEENDTSKHCYDTENSLDVVGS